MNRKEKLRVRHLDSVIQINTEGLYIFADGSDPEYSAELQKELDKAKAELVQTLAKEFSKVLSEWLEPDQMRDIVMLNARYEQEYPDMSVCATGDYCDSNMAMNEAFENIGYEFDMEKHTDLWNSAWDKAKEDGFYLKGDEK